MKPLFLIPAAALLALSLCACGPSQATGTEELSIQPPALQIQCGEAQSEATLGSYE